MGAYIVKRVINSIVLLFFISVFSFFLIQLPPSDIIKANVDSIVEDADLSEEQRQELIDVWTRRYNLDRPPVEQYLSWIGKIISKGDFGFSISLDASVNTILKERLPLSVGLAFFTLFGFSLGIGIPIGIYSATRPNSLADRFFTFIGFIGRAMPNFLLALILMILLYKWFGIPMGGLFSPQYKDAAWSLGKVFDLAAHLIAPVIVIGTATTAGTIRIVRGALLDELGKEYVRVARSKGNSGLQVLKYPIRIALNPVVAGIGWSLPFLIGGMTLTAIVMNVPVLGPVLYQGLLSQDMYLAGSIFLILSTLTVFGTLVSDVLLVFLDPRISYEKRGL